MRRARKPSPQTFAVLAALAEDPTRWRHGYDLCRSLGLKAGTVYPILIRLSDRGYIETEWEHQVPRGRPPRHLYRLTTRGAVLVAELRDTREPISASLVRPTLETGPG